MQRILNALHSISDSGNELLSKFIVYAGVSGSTVGIANNMVTPTATTPDDYAFWGMIAGVAGGLSLVIKSLSGVYFDYQKEKRNRIEFNRRHDDDKYKEEKDQIRGDD